MSDPFARRVFLDVLSESINNPIRLLLGWSIIISNAIPPSSILLAYWMGGAFLMAVKRYSEYRFIGNPALAGQYRRSFNTYTEQSLLLSSFFYAILSSFFLGIFLIKYRVEFILSFPIFSLVFVWYLAIGMRPDSAAKDPEKIFCRSKIPRSIGSASCSCCILIFCRYTGAPILARENRVLIRVRNHELTFCNSQKFCSFIEPF